MMRSATVDLSGPVEREREFMTRALAGDTEAYGDLFEMCQPKIFRMAYGILHDNAAAEDAVQETFLKGLDRISTYRGDSAPRAWFASIALNVCRHRIREGKHLESGVTDRTLEGGRRIFRPRTRAAASRAVQHEDHRLLAIAMGFLTESQREVFLLHYDQGLSYDEIGEILGLRAGAARALAHRAKANLREKLGSEIWISKYAGAMSARS
jgi:RNA polymerase sigma-70 factor (ECF subfamily)